jgi:hypothetical protein
MGEYTRAVLALAAISLVAVLLFPAQNEKSKRAFALALSLIALVILARPLATLSEYSFAMPELESGEIADLIENAEGETYLAVAEAVGEGIALDIASRFALPREALSVVCTLALTEGELTVAQMTVTLARGALHADHIAIRDYARKTYTQNCEVTTDV